MARPSRTFCVLLTIICTAVFVSLLLKGHIRQSTASLSKIYRLLTPVNAKSTTDTQEDVTSSSTFQQRRQHYINACAARRRSHDLGTTKSAGFFHVGGLAMCLVPKTGSTLWKQILFYLDTNQTGPFFEVNFGEIHDRMNKRLRPVSELTTRDEEFVTAVLVREPYTRLFSAYVDKLFKPREDNWRTGPFFEVNFDEIHARMNKRRKPVSELITRDEEFVTAVLVREPYSRLFSAYVDKLFKPREDNWRVYGRPVVSYLLKTGAVDVSKTCGAGNVTFAEFVRYFIDAETKPEAKLRRDVHYIPQSQQCGFCTSVVGSPKPQDSQRMKMLKSVRNKRQGSKGHNMDNIDTSSMGHFQDKLREGFLVYDFIGKTESILADTWAILEASHLARRLPASFDMDKEAGKNTIARTIRKVFESASTTTSSCMSKEEKLRRTWKNLQIRGMISKRELFPLTPAEADDVTIGGMQELALAAFDRSTSDPELKGNKMEAMIEAYSTIPLTDRQALRRIYAADFELFQYPPSIPEVFPEGDKFHLGPYRFFNIFDG
ncbi:hypothetical protein BaRGS_00035529 [Batillaria attramentaria]|uniref:Carbohydrate sulfotransferase n=1 Tax=Batillaria attramentaria TaxID=370345 RepID=A0ABD0JE85_9CAEN